MIRVGDAATAPDFPEAAGGIWATPQLRRNVRHATDVHSRKARGVVGEPTLAGVARGGAPDQGPTLAHLDTYLTASRRTAPVPAGRCTGADADEANRTRHRHHPVARRSEVIKVKTMTSDETGLTGARSRGHRAARDRSRRSDHSARPRSAVAHSWCRRAPQTAPRSATSSCGMQLTDSAAEPEDLTGAARRFLREKFLRVPIGFSGANFLVAESGAVCVVESEGNARMCLTLPQVLITMAGIEKVVPTLQDLEVFLQLLPRSATGERMNPYNTIWTGVTPGDGPQEFHIILLDNGRTKPGDRTPRNAD